MSPQRTVPEKKKQQANRSGIVIAAIVVVAILVIAVVASILTQPSAPSSVGSKTKGDPKAALAIVEYSDFQ